MTHEIIKTENYLLVVDDSEIKKGDWFYNRVLSQSIKVQGVWLDKVDNLNSNLETFKVIAYLPFNNSPILQGVDLLPPLEQEDDVEKLADETYPKTYYSGIYVDGWLKAGFIKGYNKAKENLHEILSDFYYYATDGEVCKHETINEFIQSLSQPKTPVAFECDTEITHIGNGTYSMDAMDLPLTNLNPIKVIKTITNSQGQTQWVGIYVYA